MTAFTETYRGSVAAWECDQYGHMNVQFYVARISDAAASMMLARGFSPRRMESRRLGIVAVDQRISYRRELHAGALIRMESALKSVEGRKITFVHRLFDAETGELAMQAEVLGLCFDLDARKSVSVPEDMAREASAGLLEAEAPETQLAIPAPEAGMLAGCRAPVNAWECDRMGHMNVQFYLHRASEADRHVFLACGLGPHALRRRGLALRPWRYHLQFRREMHSGAVTRMRSGVRRVDGQVIEICHELLDAETGQVSAQVESRIGLEDLASRAAAPLPPEAIAAASQLAAGFAGPDILPAQTGPHAPDRPDPRMFETSRGSVERWECDEHGALASRFYIGIFSAAAGNLMAGAGVDGGFMREQGLGSAALDYVIDLKGRFRVSDGYFNRTGMLEFRDKTWRFCHLLTDANSNQIVAKAEIVAVMFDMKTRKSVALPDEVRRGFGAHLIADAGQT